ncbi:GNAT family N-acetyltransferase [Rhizobium sp. Root1220]|uniref:GNAT family N-acetyltransferase n=1 Tax=Rhizobium sp. Root1220 TaxID=1736432 RepID=UPI001FCCF901|nr:GNAT family N-acetyltransferase [Rhizobium sp. Root1220]
MPETEGGISRVESLDARFTNANLDVVVIDAMPTLEQAWRELECDDLNSLHQGYDWCLAWVRAYQNPLAILWGKLAHETAFILPLEITRSHGARVATFIGADHSNINTGLFSNRFLEGTGDLDAHRFADLLRQALAGLADLLLLQNIPLEWRGRQNPLALLPMVQNQNHAYRLPLLDSFDTTLRQLNAKNRRKKFRVQSKRLEALGGFEYVAGGTTNEQHRLLDLFFKQKSERFETLGLPDVFARPETKQFLHGAIDIRDADRQILGLEMHAIRLKGQRDGYIAALSGISRKGDHVICQFSSIDESVGADASPGEFLFWQMIEGQHNKGVSMFDFGLGDQGYKRSWAPVETAHYDVVLSLTARGSVAGLAHRAITRGKAFVKSHPRLYRIAQRTRRMIGV